jgi:hypothetical protein
MKITNISQKPLTDYEINILKELKSIKREKIVPKATEIQPGTNNWQKDILLNAISNLENNKQVDNSHPLGKLSNAPIESFDEALIELNYFKSPFFKKDASEAQANLKPQDIVSLFSEVV